MVDTVEVEAQDEPAEGEVMIYTLGGGFTVKGTVLQVARRLAEEEWPTFELVESSDHIIIRSAQVVALRGGTKAKKGPIGFHPR